MTRNPAARRFIFTLLPVVLLSTMAAGQAAQPPADPAKGFDLAGPPSVNGRVITAPPAAALDFLNGPVYLLPAHGKEDGGVDRGYRNVGIIFGARIFGDNVSKAVELFYYIPSQPDNLYRAGDYRSSTGRIGSTAGNDGGVYFCPEGYVAVGLQGGSGLGIDRVGFVCGKLGNLSQVVALPVSGGQGGTSFYDNCASLPSTGLLTGVRIRAGMWMDSIQGICQAAPKTEAGTSGSKPSPKL